LVEINTHFRNFWAGFDPAEFFIPMIEGIHESITVVQDERPADIEFVSTVIPWPSRARRLARKVHRNLHARGIVKSAVARPAQPSASARASVWFTGENIRPPALTDGWDLTLSFDPDSTLSSNVYMPQWWMLLPELLQPVVRTHSPENRLGRELTISELSSARVSNVAGRPGFACAIFNNPEPKRLAAVAALQTLGQVDVFGAYSGRTIPTKDEVLRNYRFCICFENDVHPGYVTEKVFDAWGGGCIPIWNGWDSQSYLNAAAMINLAQLTGLDELVAIVRELDADSQRMNQLGGLPILAREPSLAGVRQSLGALLQDKGVL